MLMRRVSLSVAILAALTLTATAQQEQQRTDNRNTAPLLLERNAQYKVPAFKEGLELPVIRMTWRNDRDAQQVIDAAEAAITLMLDGDHSEKMDAALKEVLYGDEAGTWARVSAAPQILVRYDADFDEIRLINKEIDVIREPLGRISVDEAVARANKVIDALSEQRILNRRLYSNAAIQIGYRRVGSGSRKAQPGRSQILEYRVTYRPRIEGVELANAGVRVGVMANGQIGSMRFGGVTPLVKFTDNKVEPEEDGKRLPVVIDPNRLTKRFYRTLSANVSPQVAWSRVMYAMPDGERSALLEPMLVVSFSEGTTTNKGQRVSSRRRILGFSLVDEKAKPFDFTAPTPVKSDEPTRSK
ncbi:hypothetical protein ACMG4P_14975 [Pseudovibrio denitrificans]|uniref:hypothetical protein n=1 Tax=Pseudovibrio denitrificans TaxID=258256 RepID=UPI0039BF0F77